MLLPYTLVQYNMFYTCDCYNSKWPGCCRYLRSRPDYPLRSTRVSQVTHRMWALPGSQRDQAATRKCIRHQQDGRYIRARFLCISPATARCMFCMHQQVKHESGLTSIHIINQKYSWISRPGLTQDGVVCFVLDTGNHNYKMYIGVSFLPYMYIIPHGACCFSPFVSFCLYQNWPRGTSHKLGHSYLLFLPQGVLCCIPYSWKTANVSVHNLTHIFPTTERGVLYESLADRAILQACLFYTLLSITWKKMNVFGWVKCH